MIRVLTLSASAFMLASCATTDFNLPRIKIETVEPAAKQAATVEDLPAFFEEIADRSGETDFRIGQFFRDPILEGYISEALAANRSLSLAEGNIRKAEAAVMQARAGQLPSVGYNFNADRRGRVKGGKSTANIQPGLSASWTLDLWGRLKAGRYAADASLAAAEADYRGAQHTIASSVASVYFQLVEAKTLLANARDQVAALTETARIVQAQYDQGVISGQDIALTQADLATARQGVLNAEYGVDTLTRALEILLNRYPANSLETASGFPATPAAPRPGIPSGLLERRPDLVAAERNIAAAFYASEQAKTAGLPTLGLTGTSGGASRSLFEALDPTSFIWTAAGAITGPLYDAGLVDAGVEIADVSKQQAIDNYRIAALTAFQDVENALGAIAAYRAGERELVEADRRSREALRIANIRYEAGEVSLVDVLTIQQRTFTTTANLATLRRQLMVAYVNLNLALGGDWN